MERNYASGRRAVWACTTMMAMLVSCIDLATPASAALIVYDNGAPSLNGAFLSDDDSQFRFADDFPIAVPSLVNAIRFWGVYSPSNSPTVPDDFTVIFYGNSGGLPDAANVIATYAIGDPGRVDTGNDLAGGLRVYEYVASFSDLNLPVNQYWVSVFNNTAADVDDNWAWARHAFPGNDARTLDQGATWLHEFSDSELAFQLLNLEPSQVPEPSTLVLLWTGLVAIAWGRRRAFRNRRTPDRRGA